MILVATLTLDALEQAFWARKAKGRLIHHSDRGSQYLCIRYSERLIETGVEASAGDEHDDALAETITGLSKTEATRRRGPWKGLDEVEYATLEWAHWFNTDRLLQPIGYISPAEHDGQRGPAVGAGLN